jgi:hypothetical protein
LINQAALALQIGLTARQLAEAPRTAPSYGEVLAEAARRAQSATGATGGDFENTNV